MQNNSCILFADCGTAATKVGLIDLVARAGGGSEDLHPSEYRVVGAARSLTTAAPPDEDIMVGVRQGVMQLEALTGRQLLTERGDLLKPMRSDGDGVDGFAAVTSAAPPLHAVVVGLSRDYSVASARRVVNSTCAVVDHTIAVDEESGRWGTTADDGRAGGPSAAVEKLAELMPDLIVMVGGVDGGAVAPLRELANIVAAVGAATDESRRPQVIFAGNRSARRDVAERISGVMPLRTVENVLPALERPNPLPLQREIEAIYRERQMARLPGFDELAAWSQHGVMTSADGYTRVAEYLANKYQLRVLALDMGAGSTLLVRADADGSSRALIEQVNLGYGLEELLSQMGLERIARWLPNSVEEEELHAALLNQAIRPWTTPRQWQDLAALNAAGREILTCAAEAWSDGVASAVQGNRSLTETDLVLLTGAPLARGNKPNALMLMLLDALDVRGIFSVAGDVYGLAPALGAVAALNPEAAAQALERDCLVTWGTAFVPQRQSPARGGVVMDVQVEPARGGMLLAEVEAGALELVPLGVGEKAHIEIRARSNIQWEQSGRGFNSERVLRREVRGGSVGLLIDARGRPLAQGEGIERQRELAQQWLWEVGA